MTLWLEGMRLMLEGHVSDLLDGYGRITWTEEKQAGFKSDLRVMFQRLLGWNPDLCPSRAMDYVGREHELVNLTEITFRKTGRPVVSFRQVLNVFYGLNLQPPAPKVKRARKQRLAVPPIEKPKRVIEL